MKKKLPLGAASDFWNYNFDVVFIFRTNFSYNTGINKNPIGENGLESLLEFGAVFLTAFLSATLIPGVSEAVLVATLLGGSADPVLLVLAATVGNTAGAVLNWLLGRFLGHLSERSWFPVSPSVLEKAGVFFRKYGVWSLLFAWLPFIGDPLTLLAGILKVPLFLFIVLVLIGKTARYIVILKVFVW